VEKKNMAQPIQQGPIQLPDHITRESLEDIRANWLTRIFCTTVKVEVKKAAGSEETEVIHVRASNLKKLHPDLQEQEYLELNARDIFKHMQVDKGTKRVTLPDDFGVKRENETLKGEWIKFLILFKKLKNAGLKVPYSSIYKMPIEKGEDVFTLDYNELVKALSEKNPKLQKGPTHAASETTLADQIYDEVYNLQHPAPSTPAPVKKKGEEKPSYLKAEASIQNDERLDYLLEEIGKGKEGDCRSYSPVDHLQLYARYLQTKSPLIAPTAKKTVGKEEPPDVTMKKWIDADVAGLQKSDKGDKDKVFDSFLQLLGQNLDKVFKEKYLRELKTIAQELGAEYEEKLTAKLNEPKKIKAK
jgi:hypothetical protein